MRLRTAIVTALWAIGLTISAAAPAFAQGDEIQVYDGGLAPTGVFNLTWHNNFTPKGPKIYVPTAGMVQPDRSFNGVTEWAYGVNSWFEAGLYLPLYTYDKELGWGIDGMKLRTLFATPNGADRKVAIGLGWELSFNAKRWDSTRVTSEFRPIIAWHVNPKVDIIVNPIVDTAYDGLSNLVFVPSARLAYNVSPAWAVALESYSDFGPLKDFLPKGEQAHQLYGVIDHVTKNGFELEFGAGVGLTDVSDRFVLKVIVARDLWRLR